MIKNTLEPPAVSCAYERYDVETLQPSTDSTYTRLIETGWCEKTFRDKSVLDIGCNSGALSLFAHDLGAVKVHSVDVQDPFVDFFSEVVSRHNLPISVEKKGFSDLDPAVDGADVVLFMEVLHWVVDQGGNIPDAIARVAGLTREVLFIETPWDIREPSIARKGIVTEDQYNIELIFRELTRHFSHVEIVRFMTYFGAMPNSKRVLIRAATRRGSSLSLRNIRDANKVAISLKRGSNSIDLVTTTVGPKVIKSIPKHSIFQRLDEDRLHQLCVFLNSSKEDVIVPPEMIGSSFVGQELDGNSYMIFPFLGVFADYFPKARTPRKVKDPMSLAVMVSRQLSKAPPDLVDAVKGQCSALPAFNHSALDSLYRDKLREYGLEDILLQTYEFLSLNGREYESTLIHGDLQSGNMLLDKCGKDRVVDLDLMRTGPRYADILTCGIYTGATLAEIEKALDTAQEFFRQPVNEIDIYFSMGIIVLWLRAISSKRDVVPDGQVDRVIRGMATVKIVFLRL